MPIKMYDLAGADDTCRFSPYCWRARMALAHKGLEVETHPLRFVEKEPIAASGKGLLPVIIDGEELVHDSWAIAEYLDQYYPDRPPLMAGSEAQGLSRFVRLWADRTLNGAVLRCTILDLEAKLHEMDKVYFRESREKRFGMSLEDFAGDQSVAVMEFSKLIVPIEAVLKEQPYLAGSHPAFADYILFGSLQWPRVTSPVRLYAQDSLLQDWMNRLLDCFDGLGRQSPACV